MPDPDLPELELELDLPELELELELEAELRVDLVLRALTGGSLASESPSSPSSAADCWLRSPEKMGIIPVITG